MLMADAWLVVGARVIASATVAETRVQRMRGLIGTREGEFAFVLPKCRWVHSVGMRYPIDVGYLDADSRLVRVQRLEPMRMSLPVPASRTVIEARAGSFARWGLQLGDVVDVRRT